MEAINGIKIFKMSDCEYWAGRTLEECAEDYMQEHGDDPDLIEDAHELSDREVDSERINLEDAEIGIPEEMGDPTFRQYLEAMIKRGDEFPAMFAASE